MSVVLRCVAVASLAFAAVADDPYPDGALKYLADVNDAIRTHADHVKFLKSVMQMDYLWSPVLNEKVSFMWPAKNIDHYADNAPQEKVKTMALPLDTISALMADSTFAGTDVQRSMTVFRTALACSVLKHVSLETVMIHQLFTKFSVLTKLDEKKQMVGWLNHMIQLSIDKLAAVDQPVVSITRLRLLVAELLLTLNNPDAPLNIDDLHDIGFDMYKTLDEMCVVPDDEGHYGELLRDLNRTRTVEDLKTHRTLFTDSMRGASEVKDVEIMQQYSGLIEIDLKINLDDVKELNVDVLKRATAANYIQMVFWFMNFPIQTLAESQWVTLSKLRQPNVNDPVDPASTSQST